MQLHGHVLPSSLLGQVLALRRCERRLAQHTLAKRTKLTQATISRIELGQQTATVEHLWAISRELDTSPGELTEQTEQFARWLQKLGLTVTTDGRELETSLRGRALGALLQLDGVTTAKAG